MSDVVYYESQINFNPGDGCDTQFVAGRQGNPYDGSGNYLIYSEDNEHITSRWFIIDQTRNLRNQYTITLHRDVIADEYSNVMNADMVVESAIVPDTNPLIYNAEPIMVNQIKVDEKPIKDKSNCAWLVGYFDKKKSLEVSLSKSTNYDSYVEMPFLTWQSKLKDEKFQTSYGLSIMTTKRGSSINTVSSKGSYYLSDKEKLFKETNVDSTSSTIKNPGSYYIQKSDSFPTADSMYNEFASNNVFTNLKNQYHFNKTSNYDNYLNLNNKVVRFTESNGSYSYYKVTITESTGVMVYSPNYSINKSVGIHASMTNLGFSNNSASDPQIDYQVFYRYLTLSYITKMESGTFEGTLNTGATYDESTGKGSWVKLLAQDAPYGIFAIPYGDDITVNGYKISKNVSLLWAQEAFRLAGGTSSTTYLYDLQLLPFCPCPGWIKNEGEIQTPLNSSGGINGNYFDLIKDGETVKSIILYPQSQSFTNNIDFSIPVENIKIDTTCNFYRLCSPNFNGQFEFNAAKNQGVYLFNIDCTYKPYNPYIHINPDFKNLYGADYNDARGLICQGDFSLSVMNDAWINYTNSNKNYENIFNRQIENMETNRKYQRVSEIASAVVGTIQGTAAGAYSGNAIGGPVGGAIGAVVGGVTSAVGGAMDVAMSENLYKESVSFAKDNWAMQTDNVKALAQSVGKTTSFTNNNKIFPIVEYYSCKDEEKEFVANKIAYNSMSVGVIGKPIDYIYNKWSYNGITSKGFFKGKLLHADIDADAHYLLTLTKELELGGYFTWE